MLCVFIAAGYLSACASSEPSEIARKLVEVPAGMTYPGTVFNITAPKSEGWYLVKSTSRETTFVRRLAPGESFVAQIVLFHLESTSSPEEFKKLIVKRGRDLDTQRFAISEVSHTYTESRGYPCLQVYVVGMDRKARVGGGGTEEVILENQHLYCRHPARADMGFAVTYSYRGRAGYPQFKAEAGSFIEGIQVPDAGVE